MNVEKEKIFKHYYNEMLKHIQWLWDECCEEQTVENLYFEVDRNPFIPTLEDSGYDQEVLEDVLERHSSYDLAYQVADLIIQKKYVKVT